MNKIELIRDILAKNSNPNSYSISFFKTDKLGYASHDKFIGVSAPILRKIAKENEELSFIDLQVLISSSINEERLLALCILTNRYKKSSYEMKETIYQFYLKNIAFINNWNLVDSSAHLIIGSHLFNQKNKDLIDDLAKSNDLWEKRIAIISTLFFIKSNNVDYTYKIAKILLNDKHDLIHKATGWMLREAGKKNLSKLLSFLESNAFRMPRTMLRYSIEKLSQEQKTYFLSLPRLPFHNSIKSIN